MIIKSRLEPGWGWMNHADMLHRLQDLVCLIEIFSQLLMKQIKEGKKGSFLASYLSHLQHCHGNMSARFETLNRAADGEIMRNNPILQVGCFPGLQRLTCSHTV